MKVTIPDRDLNELQKTSVSESGRLSAIRPRKRLLTLPGASAFTDCLLHGRLLKSSLGTREGQTYLFLGSSSGLT